MCCPKKIQQMFLFQFKPKDEKVSLGVNFLNIMIVRCNDDAMSPPPTTTHFRKRSFSKIFDEIGF